MKNFQIFLFILFIYDQVIAENLYQYTDISGNLVISNKKPAGSKKFYLGTNEDARHKILQEELEHEKAAIKQLNNMQETNKISLYDVDILLHQKNINVLTQQLNQE